MSETLSIKISPLEKARLQKIAEVRAVTMSQLLREGLQKVINTSADEDGAAAKDQAMRWLARREYARVELQRRLHGNGDMQCRQ